jgi:hypothetical protein
MQKGPERGGEGTSIAAKGKYDGRTTLHYAAMEGHKDVVALMCHSVIQGFHGFWYASTRISLNNSIPTDFFLLVPEEWQLLQLWNA